MSEQDKFSPSELVKFVPSDLEKFLLSELDKFSHVTIGEIHLSNYISDFFIYLKDEFTSNLII